MADNPLGDLDTLRYFEINFQMRDNGPTYNVLDVWKMGYTGRGVVVGVVDDGLHKDHPELKDNYVSTYPYQTDMYIIIPSLPACLPTVPPYLLSYFLLPLVIPFFSSKLRVQVSVELIQYYDLI